MSEKTRKAIGAFLAVLAVVTAVSGLLPVRRKTVYERTGRGNSDILLPAISRISESDRVNTGDLYELTELPGIGETIAGLLIEERETNGLFIYPEDLTDVKGIGLKKMEQIRPFLITEEDESEE